MANEATDRRDDTALAAKAAAILGAIFTVAALGFYGGKTALSVAVGALIAVANLLTMRAIIRALIRPPDEPGDKPAEDGAEPPRNDGDARDAGRRGGVAWGVFAVLKIVLLFGAIWILLTRGLVDPIPLAVGYGVLPLGIFASTLWAGLTPRR